MTYSCVLEGTMDQRTLSLVLTSAYLVTLLEPAQASDWPMWRFSATRGAASPGELPKELHLRWTRQLPPYRRAWPNERRLHFDASYEPVVMDGLLFIGSPLDGSVVAFATDDGRERWRFYTEGPVRFAPVASQGRVYVGSDDGHLYCLDASSGELRWKVRGPPKERDDFWHLGNGRLVSFWPIRGGPVLTDGVLYFAAGIWPTHGVFIKAVDAKSGKTLWVNSECNYIENVRIDHNNLHEAGLSPQGYLLLVGDKLLVPNGRSMPAGLDRDTGKLLYYVQGYRHGDCRVTAADGYAFVGNSAVVNLSDGREVGNRWVEAGKDAPRGFETAKYDLFEGPIFGYKFMTACNARSVLHEQTVYGMQQGTCYAYDLSQPKISLYDKKRGSQELKPARWDLPTRWTLETKPGVKRPATNALIRAGSRLYGHAGNVVIAIDLAKDSTKASVAWERPLDSTPTSMVAADGKLFVVTGNGTLHCYGAKPRQVKQHQTSASSPSRARVEMAHELVQRTGVSEGYCVVMTRDPADLVEALLARTKLYVAAFEPRRAQAAALRQKLVTTGLYGDRAQVFACEPQQLRLPPYLASLIVLDRPDRAALQSLRPYGGVACFTVSRSKRPALIRKLKKIGRPSTEVQRSGPLVLLRRSGALPGSAYWTHECADAARSYYSQDGLVRAPLGVLWYGDGAGYGFYKRKDYGIGVKPQVIGGRVFSLQIAGRTLHANDAYTGRLLWKSKVDPFTRYASMPDGIYVAGGSQCTVFDPATGESRATYAYATKTGETPAVSDIRVSDDVILIAAGFEKVRAIEKGLWDSKVLVALDRRIGKQLWQREAQERFNNHAIAIGGDTVFCIDSMSGAMTDGQKRRGDIPKEVPSTILALDARTGKERWRAVTTGRYQTYGMGHWLGMRGNDDWVAYSEAAELLLTGKYSNLHAFHGKTGKEAWHKTIGGGQPMILRGGTLLTQAGHTYNVRTGELLSDKSLFKRGGCNYGVANEHLVFLREFCASYVDIGTKQKHRLRNVRSGCSNSLVAADGILSAPCFSVGCICNYPIQTSFAMVHMPEVGAWAGDRAIPARTPK